MSRCWHCVHCFWHKSIGLFHFTVVIRKVINYPSISLESKLVEILIWGFWALCHAMFWHLQLDNIQGSISHSSSVSSSLAALTRAASPTIQCFDERWCLTIAERRFGDLPCRSALTSHGHLKWRDQQFQQLDTTTAICYFQLGTKLLSLFHLICLRPSAKQKQYF